MILSGRVLSSRESLDLQRGPMTAGATRPLRLQAPLALLSSNILLLVSPSDSSRSTFCRRTFLVNCTVDHGNVVNLLYHDRVAHEEYSVGKSIVRSDISRVMNGAHRYPRCVYDRSSTVRYLFDGCSRYRGHTTAFTWWMRCHSIPADVDFLVTIFLLLC